MSKKFTGPGLTLACCALLAACGGAPASNELRFNYDGNGRFSGGAGAGWTEQEIRSHAANTLCGNRPVAEFQVSVLPTAPDYKIFSGRCAAGGPAAAIAGTGQDHIAAKPPTTSAPTTVPTASSGVWDGSTPFVD
ncbi:hypothetical protein KUV61_02160 [Nocardioides marinus]|nr:hypothetical protein [Nocardioides marinus]